MEIRVSLETVKEKQVKDFQAFLESELVKLPEIYKMSRDNHYFDNHYYTIFSVEKTSRRFRKPKEESKKIAYITHNIEVKRHDDVGQKINPAIVGNLDITLYKDSLMSYAKKIGEHYEEMFPDRKATMETKFFLEGATVEGSESNSESTPEHISALESEVLKPKEEKRDIFK
jgi:hypothetical protein